MRLEKTFQIFICGVLEFIKKWFKIKKINK